MSKLSEVGASIDLTKPFDAVVKKPVRVPLRWLQYEASVFAKMLADFESARPDESIVWTSGFVDEIGLAWVKRYWGCKLKYASEVGAETSPEWLASFAQRLRSEEPGHNLVLENHSHPIGSQLSNTDENGLYALYDWSWDMYWVMTACDFKFGVYTVDDKTNTIFRIPWGVERVWIEHEELKKRYLKEKGSRSSPIATSSTMSSFSLVRGLLGKLRKQQ